MDDETAKLALELIQAMQDDLDAMKEDMREIKRCLTSIETSVTGIAGLMQAFR